MSNASKSNVWLIDCNRMMHTISCNPFPWITVNNCVFVFFFFTFFHQDSRTSTIKPRRAPTDKNAERERCRVRSLRQAFHTLQSCIPTVPANTKLSKLDVLILATNYIEQLMQLLACDSSHSIDLDFNGNVQHLTATTTSESFDGTAERSHRYIKFYHPIKVSSLYNKNCNDQWFSFHCLHTRNGQCVHDFMLQQPTKKLQQRWWWILHWRTLKSTISSNHHSKRTNTKYLLTEEEKNH